MVSEGRRGTFIAARPPLGASAAAPVPPGTVDLATGNPDPSLLPPVGRALAAVPTRPILYGHPAVSDELLELLSGDLRGDGIDATSVCVVGGALDGIERTLASQCRPGDRVGVEDPGYSSVAELVTAMSLRAEPVAVDELGPRPESLAAAIDRGVEAIVVTPRAGNPTGAALDRARASELRAVLASGPGVLVVEDDHAGRVAGQPYVSIVPEGAERWAMVRSMAKSLGPDLRLAAMAGDRATVARVVGRQSLGAGWVSHILQSLVANLLTDPDLDRVLTTAAQSYAARRAVVIDALQSAGIEAHGRSGLNVWVPVDDEATVVAGMLRAGYAIQSGARFRIASEPGVRLSIGGADEATLGAAADALIGLLTSDRSGRAVSRTV